MLISLGGNVQGHLKKDTGINKVYIQKIAYNIFQFFFKKRVFYYFSRGVKF
jgi:hypothetical protein